MSHKTDWTDGDRRCRIERGWLDALEVYYYCCMICSPNETSVVVGGCVWNLFRLRLKSTQALTHKAETRPALLPVTNEPDDDFERTNSSKQQNNRMFPGATRRQADIG